MREVPRPTVDAVAAIMKAGSEAGLRIIELGQQQLASAADGYAPTGASTLGPAGAEQVIARVVRAHRRLARTEGAAAGIVASGAEASTVTLSGGTVTIPALLATTLGDLTALTWVQLRMHLIIAAVHGHDPRDPARLREFLLLQGATGALGGPAIARPLGNIGENAARRLILRHLSGETLLAVKAACRVAGLNFSRAALLRQLFLLNIPLNAAVNDAITAAFARRCTAYYRDLPSAGRVAA